MPGWRIYFIFERRTSKLKSEQLQKTTEEIISRDWTLPKPKCLLEGLTWVLQGFSYVIRTCILYHVWDTSVVSHGGALSRRFREAIPQVPKELSKSILSSIRLQKRELGQLIFLEEALKQLLAHPLRICGIFGMRTPCVRSMCIHCKLGRIRSFQGHVILSCITAL